MTIPFWFDLETFSPTPIRDGSHAYAEPSEIMLFAYALGDRAVNVWDLTEDDTVPAAIRQAAEDPDVLWWGQNSSMFDWVVTHHALPWLNAKVPLERRRDTRVQAYCHSLPGGLDDMCAVLGVPEELAKHKGGRDLINLFCKPPAKNMKRGRATRHTHPEEWARFISYAGGDITSMREAYKRMPNWNYENNQTEMDLWYLDQRINLRGINVDVELAEAAVAAVGDEQHALAAYTQVLTDGEVAKATKRDAMLKHLLAEYGVELPDMKKSTIERRIEDTNLPWALRELLAVRLSATTTSTSKYKTLLRSVSSDGRLRGTKQFCGASRTGRWAARLFQPDNMARPTLPQDEIDSGIDALKACVADLVCPDIMRLTSSAVRGCIVAPKRKKLVVADLSNIEGRMLAWLAGEEWKLRAFADYDTVLQSSGAWLTGPQLREMIMRGEVPYLELDAKGEPVRLGHDLYKLAYAKSFGIRPEDVTKDMRQIGKVMELALGYEGGIGAFITFALAYNIDLDEMAQAAWDTLPEDAIDEARGMLEWTRRKRRSTYGLEERTWLVCEVFKARWRKGHAEVKAFWREMGDAAKAATEQPGRTIRVRRLAVRRDGNWLRIRLPSGRYLCYPQPEVNEKGEFSYMGVNQYSRKWSRIKSYGGKLVENVTQAASRDVLGHGMPLVEDAGYAIVLTVHDEIITETPDTADYTSDHLAALMATVPEWAQGLPLSAAGFESSRYRKD